MSFLVARPDSGAMQGVGMGEQEHVSARIDARKAGA